MSAAFSQKPAWKAESFDATRKKRSSAPSGGFTTCGFPPCSNMTPERTPRSRTRRGFRHDGPKPQAGYLFKSGDRGELMNEDRTGQDLERSPPFQAKWGPIPTGWGPIPQAGPLAPPEPGAWQAWGRIPAFPPPWGRFKPLRRLACGTFSPRSPPLRASRPAGFPANRRQAPPALAYNRFSPRDSASSPNLNPTQVGTP